MCLLSPWTRGISACVQYARRCPASFSAIVPARAAQQQQQQKEVDSTRRGPRAPSDFLSTDAGQLHIRPADADDWLQIYPFFMAIVAAGKTYAYPEALSSAQAHAPWMEPPPGQTVVALEDGVVVGSAKMGPNRPGRGTHVATASFMVALAQQGRGVGRALGEYALRWARAAGYRAMQFNAVVETNVHALRLWEALGFAILGTAPGAFLHPRHGYVGLHMMFQTF